MRPKFKPGDEVITLSQNSLGIPGGLELKVTSGYRLTDGTVLYWVENAEYSVELLESSLLKNTELSKALYL